MPHRLVIRLLALASLASLIGPATFAQAAACEALARLALPETKIAPARVVASHATNGAIDRMRPLCPYPQVAQYTGTGSVDEAANFVCRMPAK